MRYQLVTTGDRVASKVTPPGAAPRVLKEPLPDWAYDLKTDSLERYWEGESRFDPCAQNVRLYLRPCRGVREARRGLPRTADS